MPQNVDFSIQVLVGGSPIPEYESDGRYYVESNLATPFSYRLSATEIVNGEEETQMWPVTPYQLCLCARTKTPEPCYYRILVDGVKVKGLSIAGGQARIIKGFRDGACIREFLFSMPRFAKDQADRITDERKDFIGMIEVQCWNATLRKTKYGLKRNYLEFQQANKKDSVQVTNGDYTMATSKAGKVVCSRSLYRSVDNWKLTTMRSTIKVYYHMGHTLQSMAFTLRPYEYRKEALQKNSVVRLKKPGRRDSKTDGGSSSEKTESQGDEDDDIEDVVVTAGDMENGKRKRRPTPTLIDLTEEEDQELRGESSKTDGKTSEEPSVKSIKTEIKTEKGSPKKSAKTKDDKEPGKEVKKAQAAETEESDGKVSKEASPVAMGTTDGEAAVPEKEADEASDRGQSPMEDDEAEKSPSSKKVSGSKTGEEGDEKDKEGKGDKEGRDKDDEGSGDSNKGEDGMAGGLEELDASLVNKESISAEVADLLKTLGIPVTDKTDEDKDGSSKENSDHGEEDEADGEKNQADGEKSGSSPEDSGGLTLKKEEEDEDEEEPMKEQECMEKNATGDSEKHESGEQESRKDSTEEPNAEQELNQDGSDGDKESERDSNELEGTHNEDMIGGEGGSEQVEKTDDELLNEEGCDGEIEMDGIEDEEEEKLLGGDEEGCDGEIGMEGVEDEAADKLLAGDADVAMETPKDTVPHCEDNEGSDGAGDADELDLDTGNPVESVHDSQEKSASPNTCSPQHNPDDEPQSQDNMESRDDLRSPGGDADHNTDNAFQNTKPNDGSDA